MKMDNMWNDGSPLTEESHNSTIEAILTPHWQRIILASGLDMRAITYLVQMARVQGTTVHGELMSAGRTFEEKCYRTLAADLNPPFRGSIEPEELIIYDSEVTNMVSQHGAPKLVFYLLRGGENKIIMSMEFFDFDVMQTYLSKYPDIAGRLEIVAPRTFMEAILHRVKQFLARQASVDLFERYSQMSARIFANALQGFGLGVFTTVVVIGIFLYYRVAIKILHLLDSLFFSCVIFHVLATIRTKSPKKLIKTPEVSENPPAYTVLVALYKEAEVVSDLLAALERLVWPRSRLEIRLILEEHDTETLAAFQEQYLLPNIEVLMVPDLGPRTKPKALSYSMPAISGEFVTVFDAGDIPQSVQLLESWKKSSNRDALLACIQALLHIRNSNKNLLTIHFDLPLGIWALT